MKTILLVSSHTEVMNMRTYIIPEQIIEYVINGFLPYMVFVMSWHMIYAHAILKYDTVYSHCVLLLV